MKIDLHSHTTASDGQLTPAELIERASTMQVSAIAITDHDTVAGLSEAQQTIDARNLPIDLIPGIELSTRWRNFGIHVVGLNIDPNHSDFQSFVARQKQIRLQRAEKIADKLERTGFTGIFEQARQIAGKGEITRSHFARALVLHHGLGSLDQAFKRFMGKGNVGDVKAEWPTTAEAISIIHQANGQAVLAHPLKYDMSTKWLRRLINDFAQDKGDGAEVAGPGVVGQQQRLLHEIVASANLKGSAGSDFHSPGRWTELGRFQQVLPPVEPVWHDWPALSVAYSR